MPRSSASSCGRLLELDALMRATRSSVVLTSRSASASRSFSASTWVLSATISTCWLSAIAELLVELAHHLGEFGFLVGERALGVVHGGWS